MKMKITRPKDLSILSEIKPLIIASHPSLVPIIIADIALMMANNPAGLLFLVGKKDDSLLAFLVAVDPGPAYPYSIVWQLWSHNDNPRNWIDPFFDQLIMFSVSHGKEYIRSETQRNLGALLRRTGFEPHMQVVKYDLKKHTPEEIIHE